MKVIIFAVLATTILAHSKDFSIKLKHDGPTVTGGKINFIAKLFEKKDPAIGSFKFDWEDNTYAHHSASHETDSPVDVWSVSYPQHDVPLPGKYVTTITIHKKYNGVFVAVARLQIKFEILRSSKEEKKPHPVISQSWMDYKRDKILNSQSHALDNIDDPRVKSIVSNRIDLTNERIPLMSTSSQQEKNTPPFVNNILNYKRQRIADSQQRQLDQIWHPAVKSLVANRINYINSRIPIMQDSFAVPLEKHNQKIEELRESENALVNSIQEPIIKEAVVGRIKEENKRVPYLSNAHDVVARFSGALDSVHERMKEIKNTQKLVLKNIKDAVKREEALKKIEEENMWLETRGKELDSELSEALNTIHRKMVELKTIEAETLGAVEDPVVKENVRVKLNTQNEKVVTLLDDTPEAEFPTPLEEVSGKIRDLEIAEWEAVETVKDPILREIILNKLNEHNKEMTALLKLSEDDSKLVETIDEAHGKIHEQIKKVDDAPVLVDSMITKQRNEKPNGIEANLTATLTEVRNKIVALKKTEQKMVDETVGSEKEQTIDIIEEHNKRIPSLLLPSVIEANFTKALDKLNQRIANMSKVVDFVTENVTNPFVLSMMQAKMALINYKLVSKYNEIRDNFTALLDEMATETGGESTGLPPVVKKSPKLSFAPGMAIPQLSDFIAQKMAMKTVPFGMLAPSATDPAQPQSPIFDMMAARNQMMQAKANIMGANMATAMALIRAKIAALQDLQNSAMAGVTDSADREVVQATFDETTKNVPLLLLPYGIESNFTKALNDFQAHINTIKDSVSGITANITVPAIKSIVSSKFDFVNQMLMNKYAQLDSNFTSILAKIQARFANLTDDMTKSDQATKKVPLLTKTMGGGPVFDLTAISDLIKNKMQGKSAFGVNALSGIKIPAIQALINDKISERSKNMSAIADQLAANFTKIMETIHNKTVELQDLETLTLDGIDDPVQQAEILSQIEDENKKIPSLNLSKGSDKKDHPDVVPASPHPRVKYPLIIRF